MFSWTFTSGAEIVAWLAFSLALIALCLSAWLFSKMRSTHRHRTLEKQFKTLQLDVLELADQYDKLLVLSKRKYGRDSMRKKRTDSPNGEMSDEEWKKEMSKQLALGGFQK